MMSAYFRGPRDGILYTANEFCNNIPVDLTIRAVVYSHVKWKVEQDCAHVITDPFYYEDMVKKITG